MITKKANTNDIKYFGKNLRIFRIVNSLGNGGGDIFSGYSIVDKNSREDKKEING